jgi:hypothetical protein
MPGALSVGTRTRDDYVVGIDKLAAAYVAGVNAGKNASKDQPRVPIATAEAGTPSPGGDETMLAAFEDAGDFSRY